MNRLEDLDRARREARRLLKALRSGAASRVAAAAERFRRLRPFAQQTEESLLAVARLKHALAVIAEERGHDSWLSLKRAATSSPPAFHAPSLGGFLFRWFADPEEAAASRRELGGYLLPFGTQYFICEPEAIRELGLDPEDPDWQAVGFDLARPKDAAAAERLHQRRRAAIRAGIGVPRKRHRP